MRVLHNSFPCASAVRVRRFAPSFLSFIQEKGMHRAGFVV